MLVQFEIFFEKLRLALVINNCKTISYDYILSYTCSTFCHAYKKLEKQKTKSYKAEKPNCIDTVAEENSRGSCSHLCLYQSHFIKTKPSTDMRFNVHNGEALT